MLQYKTRRNVSPKGKPRVYFACYGDDFKYFDSISEEILKINDCAIWFLDEDERDGDFIESLKDVKLSDKIDIREYISDMDVCMAAADLIICRAGAITLSELLACGKPAILIPSPYVAENHQFHNAMTLKRIGAADIIEEKDLTPQKLIDVVSKLIQNKPRLAAMADAAKKGAIIDANERIYEIIMRLYTNA